MQVSTQSRFAAKLSSALFLSLVSGGWLAAQDSGGTTKENLDLPYDAIGNNEDEEDAPEVVSFYGSTLEGDGFFYILDNSTTMQQGEIGIAKREVVKNIGEFSDKVNFGVFFFAKDLKKFPTSGQPAEANPGMKSSAISWINSQGASSGTCGIAAITAALNMANQCPSKRKVIVYLSDGGGTCPGAGEEADYLRQEIASASAQNWQRVQINTIGVLAMEALQEKFMKDLAASNGGSYTRISR